MAYPLRPSHCAAHEGYLTKVTMCAIRIVMTVNIKSTGQGFGDLIRALRKARNLGLVDVAMASGMDPGLLSRIETGKRNPPDLPVLTRLAKELGVSESSDTFAELVSAATRGRAKYPAMDHLDILREALSKGKPSGHHSTGLPQPSTLIFCSTLAELVSKATEQAIITDAEEITVISSSGVIQKFRLLSNAKKGKKGI